MINQAVTSNLVKIYFFVCDKFEKELQYHCQRFSNNNNPEFTDQELVTIYLFCVNQEKKFKLKQMHSFIKGYLLDWFPHLPSYVAFNTRINRLAGVFRVLSEMLIDEFRPDDASSTISLLDSMPIITCSGKRNAKVAKEITDKGYSSTKGFYYFGLKLHSLSADRNGTLPHPESIIISKASDSDLTIFKDYWSKIPNKTFFGDKIYFDRPFFEDLRLTKNSEMLTPIKHPKGFPEELKKIDKAYDDIFSKAVSSIRQPIESAFNWLIEKTDIQRANKVRSTNGLLVHIFGKLAAAFILPLLNS